ncbi:hypothetical protein Ddye_007846 [Dipteronia dyeriana]|uniref:Transposase n=1 Tax=Dipteronia dyeriana TaxID=168575 RepID=A0AAD9XLW9_9ROSI|nr:hypothetical protein Ddye_007846 [Dipteronia dyeriana]
MIKATKTKEGDVKLSTFQFDQDIARRELANMVILHEYPLSIVDHSEFQRFISSVQPMFKIPTRNTLKSDIMKLYDYERVKTLDLLKRNKGRIAITTDMWTCNNQRKGFMAITTHFVDNEWALQSRIIRFAHVQCPHTFVVLADAMMDCILDWHIVKKVSALTVDNCSTNNAMIPIILDKLSSGSTLLNEEMFHIRCSAHLSNLIVKDGLDVINDSIYRIRGSVSYWTSLPKRDEKFLETVRELEIVSVKKLALDCNTRWNSTFLIIRFALIYKNVFPRLRQRDSQYNCVLTENDWVFAKEISDRLEVFFVATEQFSGTKYPTANNYLPILCDIRCAISQWGTSTVEEIRLMALAMAQKFDSYWSEFHGFMVMATILDPRFKMKIIDCYFPIIYGDRASSEIKNVQDILLRIVREYKAKLKASSSSSSANSTHVSLSPSIMVHSRLNSLSIFDQFLSSTHSATTQMKTELDYYLDEPIIPRTDNFDILRWWNVNASKYPTLHCISRDILAIPVSTVAYESAFSTGGRFVSPHCSRLHVKTIEALMCAQDWLWTQLNGMNIVLSIEYFILFISIFLTRIFCS